MLSCEKNEIEIISSMSFVLDKIELMQEDSINLKLVINPSKASTEGLNWKSLDPSIVSINNGLAKGIKPGTTKIIVKILANPTISDTCQITVKSNIDNINLDSTQVHVTEEDSIQLQVKYFPSNKKVPEYIWQSLSPDYAIVDNKGKVKGLQTGTAKIVVKMLSDPSKADTCLVKVLPCGTLNKPYLIYKVKDLINIRNKIAAYNASWGKKYYKLMANIDFTGQTVWSPIAHSTAVPFSGSFDGNGMKITKIKFATTNTYTSFIGYVSGGEIKNLTIEFEDASTESYGAGGIAAHITADSKISMCISKGKISNTRYYAGGIVGIAEKSVISGCSSTGDILAFEASGGIVGFSNSDVLNSNASGNIYSTGKYAGGITGTGGTINGCSSTGNISVTSTFYSYTSDVCSGGIVGYGAYVYNSYSTGIVTGNGVDKTSCGGIGGDGNYVVNCYSTGNVSALSDAGAFAGGIVGTAGTVLNCYATGNIIATSKGGSSFSGGIEGSGNLIINTISLSNQVTAIASTMENCNANRVLFYPNNYLSYSKNTFVSDKITVSKGISIDNTTKITDFSNLKNNGELLNQQPLSILNCDISIFNSESGNLTRGVALNKWVVRSGVNNGNPIFE